MQKYKNHFDSATSFDKKNIDFRMEIPLFSPPICKGLLLMSLQHSVPQVEHRRGCSLHFLKTI